jgi:hypothetical protein
MLTSEIFHYMISLMDFGVRSFIIQTDHIPEIYYGECIRMNKGNPVGTCIIPIPQPCTIGNNGIPDNIIPQRVEINRVLRQNHIGGPFKMAGVQINDNSKFEVWVMVRRRKGAC